MTATSVRKCLAAVALLCSSLYTVSSFSHVKIISNQIHREEAHQCRQGSVKCNLVENSLLTLAAGALAGSIGVGVAYPLDALKTKAQTYASSRDSSSGTVTTCYANPRGL
jgi:Mitochondrial carrier protein